MQEPSYSEITFMNPHTDRPYVISNMIVSSDGNTLFTEDDSTGLGSDVDRRLMGELRFHADAVINGAETLRIAGSSSLIRSEELIQNRLSNLFRLKEGIKSLLFHLNESIDEYPSILDHTNFS